MISNSPQPRRRIDSEHRQPAPAVIRRRAQQVRRGWQPTEVAERRTSELDAMLDFLRMLVATSDDGTS